MQGAYVCPNSTQLKLNSQAFPLTVTMVLGMKVLVFLAVGIALAVALVVLPSNPGTAPAYNCYMTSGECRGATDPVYIMSKIFPGMAPVG